MVRFLFMPNVEASVMVCPAKDWSNVMVSPRMASEMAWRSDPVPLSFVLVTTKVAGVLVVKDHHCVLSPSAKVVPAVLTAYTCQ